MCIWANIGWFVWLFIHPFIHLSNCYVPSTVWEPSGEHLVGAVSILSLSVLWPSLLFLSPTFSLSHPFNFRFLPRGGIPLIWVRPRKKCCDLPPPQQSPSPLCFRKGGREPVRTIIFYISWIQRVKWENHRRGVGMQTHSDNSIIFIRST